MWLRLREHRFLHRWSAAIGFAGDARPGAASAAFNTDVSTASLTRPSARRATSLDRNSSFVPIKAKRIERELTFGSLNDRASF